MTWLPGAADAVVEPSRIAGYLLNPAHSSGRPKAAFLGRFGFTLGEATGFAVALQQHPRDNLVSRAATSDFGRRWEVTCQLRTPDGRNPCTVTVWQEDAVGAPPRLLKTYPA